MEGARIPASSAIPPVPRTPLRLRFLSPLIEPSVRISRTGLSFEIMRSHTRSRAVRPLRRSRPLCGQPPGKRTSSRTPPRASDPATDAAAVPPAPVPPTAALRRPGTRFTSACHAFRIFRTSIGACRLAPVPSVPASFPRHSRTKAPSLRRHYPASSVLRASPPPCRPKLALAGFRLARARHRQGFPCCIHIPARACCRHYPGGDDRPVSFAPTGGTGRWQPSP